MLPKMWDKTEMTYLGSAGPSGKGFIESLHRLRNTRKASFWRMWANAPADSCESPFSSTTAALGAPEGEEQSQVMAEVRPS